MKRTKNIFSIFTILIICLSMLISLPACGNKTTDSGSTTTGSGKTTQTEKTLEPYKFTMLAHSNLAPFSYNTMDSKYGQILKDKFNMEFDVEPYSGNWDEKLALMLSAGDYPELLYCYSNTMVKNYINAGALLPLDPYLDQMPNFKMRAEVQIPYWRALAADGKLYKWENEYNSYREINSSQNDFGVRIDALEALGWPNLLTEDDYINFFREALEKIPETNGKKTIGVVFPFAEGFGPQLVGRFFEKGRYTFANAQAIWDHKEEKFIDYYSDPYVKDAYSFMNKLYNAGVLDKESFTDHLDQIMEKMNSGQALGVWFCCWFLPDLDLQLEKDGLSELMYIPQPVKLDLHVQNNDNRIYKIETLRDMQSFVLTKNCKNPERILQVVDFVSSEEGQILAGWGIEGTDYEIVDGRRKMISFDTIDKTNVNFFAYFGSTMALDNNGQCYNNIADPEAAWDKYPEAAKEAFRKLGWEKHYDPWFNNPKNPFEIIQSGVITNVSINPDSDEGRIEQKLNKLRDTFVAKLVLAKDDSEFEATYAEMMREYEKLTPEKFIGKLNELYKEAALK